MSRIEIVQLTQQFKGHRAVDAVDLVIEDGDFVVLLGPSGCGKTTLLRMMAGLLEPTSGRILIDGVDVTELPSKKRNLAMVFQSYALYPHLSVAKNLAFPLAVLRTPKAERLRRVREVAASLGLENLLERRPRELSGGQRQRVAVGRALVRRPSAYLMDEPLSNLDAKLRTATRQELSELHAELSATFVYVTHDQVEAMTMATKIVVLDAGRIEQFGTPEEIYHRPASVFVAGFVGAPPMNLVVGTVGSIGGVVTATAEGIEARLWQGVAEKRTVVIGIRPEHLRLGDVAANAARVGGSASVMTVEGVVERIENLGSEQVLYLRVGDIVMTARGDGFDALRRGDFLALEAPVERIHLFDEATGQRLEWVPDPDDLPAEATQVAVMA
ncbi:ABC transporter ATP-binding protein [Subtercola endophyticus]|uniref:ABC transporter ATP-binding protein n=1 Tax=Subtercola endophyticus TaxID=2895559 RepID=UPI001E498409|nr:ABC transporter ATP-binding protein [Subtercola endophyticus]UFS60646.1 ABC transporter ATP-binding protein [Subtercola endophyticus]